MKRTEQASNKNQEYIEVEMRKLQSKILSLKNLVGKMKDSLKATPTE